VRALRPPSNLKSGSASLGLLIFVFLLGFFLQAPASWMDVLISKATQGAVRLANPEGTFWQGRAELRFIPSALQSDEKAMLENPQSFLLGKSIAWQILPKGRDLGLHLSGDALSGAISKQPITYGFSGLVIPDGQLILPALPLEQAGTVFAMLKPQADLQVRWSGLKSKRLQNDQASVWVDFNNFGTSLSPIRPLGSYRLTISGLSLSEAKQTRLTWLIESLGQPVIAISGAGQLSDMVRGQLKFQCHRQCEFVNGLLSAIGKKNGEVYEAKLGT
jgi:hypothetical protein